MRENDHNGDALHAHDCEAQTDDDAEMVDGGFAVEFDMSLLDDAIAAVERREAEALLVDGLEDGAPIDLAELASVEAELAMEIELEDTDEDENEDEDEPEDEPEDLFGLKDISSGDASVRIRAMEAESERDQLRERMDNLSRNRTEIAAQLKRATDKENRARAASQNAQQAQQAAEQRAKGLREALQKQQSDVDRLLKRRKQEKQDQYNQGRGDAVLTLVEVLDNLVLAMGHAKSNPEQMIQGVGMVVQQFEGKLTRLGVEPVPSTRGTPFDPTVHEALANEPDSDLDSGQIITTISRGYTIDGKLLRAARVSVANNASEE
jgi:molecular chaperone GrpE